MLQEIKGGKQDKQLWDATHWEKVHYEIKRKRDFIGRFSTFFPHTIIHSHTLLCYYCAVLFRVKRKEIIH